MNPKLIFLSASTADPTPETDSRRFLKFGALEAIKPLFSKVSELRGEQATLENLGRDWKSKPPPTIAHFACHGEYDPAQPLHSCLKLAHLTRLDIAMLLADKYDLGNCSLVCLSACETGVIDLNNFSDEYFSIGCVFLLLRAQNVLSTLWRVSDLSSAIFMETFYSTLKRLSSERGIHWQQMMARALKISQGRLINMSRDECSDYVQKAVLDKALKTQHLTQLAGMDEFPFRHAYFWAPYVIVSR